MQAKKSSRVLGVENAAEEVQAASELLSEEMEIAVHGTDACVAAVEAVERSGRARHHAGRPVRLLKAEAGWIAW